MKKKGNPFTPFCLKKKKKISAISPIFEQNKKNNEQNFRHVQKPQISSGNARERDIQPQKTRFLCRVFFFFC